MNASVLWGVCRAVRAGCAAVQARATPATTVVHRRYVAAAAAAAGGGAAAAAGTGHKRPPPGLGAEATALLASDGTPLLNVVFVNPQIAQNLGSFGRTSIGLGAKVYNIHIYIRHVFYYSCESGLPALLAVLHGIADMSTVRTVVCTDSKGARREADELFAL